VTPTVVLVQPLALVADLPHGYEGDYARHIEVSSGSSRVCLTIRQSNKQGRMVYVRSLYGDSPEDVDDQFVCWLCGVYESEWIK
jgi:hypothetical protein